MKTERAIEILYEYDMNFAGNSAEEIADAMQMAIEALEKQIPKPVQFELDHTWGIEEQQPVCPVCDMYLTKTVFLSVEGHGDAPRISYCDTCGQAIDWG